LARGGTLPGAVATGRRTNVTWFDLDRRDYLRLSSGIAGAGALTAGGIEGEAGIDIAQAPESIRQLRPLPGEVAPVSDDERSACIKKSQRGDKL
jgi:hypothetical protein